MVVKNLKFNLNTIKDFFHNLVNYNFTIKIGSKKIKLFLFCHRIPNRCLTIHGKTMPICSRCLGLIIGGIVSLFAIFFISFSYILLFLSPLLFLPLIFDGFTQLAKIRESNNILRLVTGLLAGIGIVLFSKFIYMIEMFT